MNERALSDLRIVEYAHFISGPFCAKLMADLGAEVIKVEEPAVGDEARGAGPFLNNVPNPERSGLFLYLNTNKLGVTLDLRSAIGAKLFKELVRDADILVENNPPFLMKELGLDYETLKGINPRLIMTSITPFGQSGPYRDYKACELVSFHMGGLGYMTPGAVENPEAEPPLKAGEHQADFLTGLLAAIVTLCAINERRWTGEGQQIDISEHEAVVDNMCGEISQYSYDKKVNLRAMGESQRGSGDFGAGGMQPCKDGYVQIHCAEEHMWRALVELMGSPEWAKSELLKERALRARNWHLIEPRLREWTMQRTKQEIYHACQSKRIPCSPINTTEDLFKSEHLAQRGFFTDIEHPEAGRLKYPSAPYKLSRTPWQAKRSAPLLGEHNEDIYCKRLSYTKEDLVKMSQAGII